MSVVPIKRPPGSLAERFWSIARTTSLSGGAGDDTTDPDPKAIVRHVLRILDALSAGEVGDGVTQKTISFLALLRQEEAAGDMSYASPEQARGEKLDERSLVFSVGVLMFEELTGRHPFGAVNNTRRFARIQKGEMGSGVQYFPQVPAQLRSVLMRAMGPFPEERFASLKELRVHLERFERGEDEPKRERPPRLKGLPPTPAEIFFDSDEDKMPTTLFRTTPASGVPASPTPARGVPVRPSRTLEVVAAPSRARVVLERLAYSLVGAVAAVGAMLIFLQRQSAAPAAPPVATPPVAAAATVAATPTVEPLKVEPAKPAAKAEPAKAEPAKAEPPARARSIEPPAVPPIAQAEQPTAFDLDFAGKNALTAARSCLGPIDHTVSFGAGLFFAKDGPLVHRIFLSPDEPLTPEQRKCMKTAFTQVSAGVAPDKGTVAEMRFKVRPGDGSADTYTFKVE